MLPLLVGVLLTKRAVELWWEPVIGALRVGAAKGAAAAAPAGRALVARTRPLATLAPPLLAKLAQHAALSAAGAHLPILIPVKTVIWLTDAFRLLQVATPMQQSQRGINLLALGAEYGICSAGHELGFRERALSGAAVLVGARLLCEEAVIPYTGRTVLLPPRWVEVFLNQTVGRLAGALYPVIAVASCAAKPVQLLAMACKCPEELWFLQPILAGASLYTAIGVVREIPRELAAAGQHQALVEARFMPLHQAALASAAAAGRPLAPAGAQASTIPATSINAVSIPGGRVCVHSRLITGLPAARRDAGVTFVVAHEVAHTLCRHAMERFVTQLLHTNGITLVAGLTGLMASALQKQLVEHARAQDGEFYRLLPFAGPRERKVEGETRGLPDEASVGMQLAVHVVSYLLCLRHSRRAEREADMVALCLARDAGMSVPATLEGAQAAFTMFEKMDGGMHLPMLLRTHPPPQQRLAALQAWVAVGPVPPA